MRAGLTHITAVSYFVEYLVALVGLGVAVDYSLLVVVRWREERGRGLSNEAAIGAAADRAGKAVLLSGATVAIGLLSLILLPVPFLRSIGVGTMLIPLVAIAAAVTLLPVTLAAWGLALDRLRFSRFPGPAPLVRTAAPGSGGRLVVRHRWLASAGQPGRRAGAGRAGAVDQHRRAAHRVTAAEWPRRAVLPPA